MRKMRKQHTKRLDKLSRVRCRNGCTAHAKSLCVCRLRPIGTTKKSGKLPIVIAAAAVIVLVWINYTNEDGETDGFYNSVTMMKVNGKWYPLLWTVFHSSSAYW